MKFYLYQTWSLNNNWFSKVLNINSVHTVWQENSVPYHMWSLLNPTKYRVLLNNILLYLFIGWLIMHVKGCTWATTQEWRSEGNFLRAVLSLHHVSLGVKLRLSELTASPFTHWAISLALLNSVLDMRKWRIREVSSSSCCLKSSSK